MKSFKALVKREYWEHRGAIFKTPAIMAAVFAGLMLLGALTGDAIVGNNIVGENGDRVSVAEKLPVLMKHMEGMGAEEREQIVQTSLSSPVMLFGGVMIIISIFFALGSLYDERKDRSILFWKSLPVSDTATVLSKLVAICLMVPVSYFVVITVFQLFLLVFATVVAWFGGSSGLSIWAASDLFSVIFNSFFSLIMSTLWMAPLWGWLMLASAWAKRVAFMWAAIPMVMIVAAEGYLFHTIRFLEMLGYRFQQGFAIQNDSFNQSIGGHMLEENAMHWTKVFTNSDFWSGLAVAAVFIAAAIYTRRFRDES